MTIQQVQSLVVTVVVVGLLIGVAGMFSGCYSSRLRSETPAGTMISHETSGPFYGRRDVVIDSRGDYERCLATRRAQGQWFWSDDQATCYQQTTSSGGRGYGGPAPDYFGYVRTQYAGTVYDPAHAADIARVREYMRTSYDPPAGTSPPEAAGAAPTDTTALRRDIDATGEAVVDINQRLIPLEEMHCRRHPRRCRRGGSR